jgi:hypothetical protein
MPVKSVQSQRVKVKRAPVEKSEPHKPHDEEETIPDISIKAKVPLELDEPEPVAVLEEKTEDELITAEEETDELGLDDSGLEEELDPFNDKWEA